MNAYLPTIPEQAQLTHARALLLHKCVTGFGLPAGPVPSNTVHDDLADMGVYGNKRRYGITSMVEAVRYGYHLPSATNGQNELAEERYNGLPETPTMRMVLYGPKPEVHEVTVNGYDVPVGGCMQRIKENLERAGGPPSFQQAELPTQIKANSFDRSLTNPKVVAAVAIWTACMHGNGYNVMHPLDAGKGFGEGTLSKTEVRQALKDVACKKQADLVGIWSKVEAIMQRQQLRLHRRELDKIKVAHQARMRAVANLIKDLE